MISHRDRNAQRIAALDERAEALGLKRGMGIADARAMHPAIDIEEADAQADRLLLEGLADWCDRYTPLVALDGADGLFLDIAGCAHLFGGERAMLDTMLTRFLQQGFIARAGIASAAGAAWAAARFASGSIVAVGEEAALLAPLPLSALRIEPAVRESLESVGLRRVGAVMATPRAPLARRFGALLLERLDQALGRSDEAVSPRLPAAPLSVERHLAEPITQIEEIERLTASLSQTLKHDLERRGEGARALGLMLFRVDGAVSQIAIGTSRPLRDPLLIQKLFHERLAATGQEYEVGYGFDLVRLSVLSVAAFDMQQTDLTGEIKDAEADIALFADRVRARLGDNAVRRPISVASHLPERSIALVAFTDAPASKSKNRVPSISLSERPVRLFRSPEPVEVPATELPEGPPLHFRWRRALYRVVRAEGPERIAPEWWRESIPDAMAKEGEDAGEVKNRAVAEKTASLTRDYFRIEDAEGRRYWLFRQGLYDAGRTSPRWFMHGIFA
ncbi:MAG TPA: DNA polymerase Y family protein [Mesorhizobium sp.]